MKKSIMLICLMIGGILLLTGCESNIDTYDYKYANMTFKELYESVNETTNSQKKENRTIEISENNPFVPVDAKKIVDMMESGETFYVYFGFVTCPWCRSVIETATNVAIDNKIDKVYYVNVHDIRDVLEVDEKGEVNISKEGSEDYYKLLDLMKDVLEDYGLTDEKGNKVDAKEKRIYAPNFVKVEDGKAKELVTGISEKLEDPRDELTEDMLKEEKDTFTKFFKN